MSFHVRDITRDTQWLESRFYRLHSHYFPDVAIENQLLITFGRKAIRRFGSITSKRDPRSRELVTTIAINRLFRHPDVPVAVIDATLLHEFTHYTHGFHSPRRRAFRHPHLGGIVDKEIISRGGEAILSEQRQWIKNQYREFLAHNYRQM